MAPLTPEHREKLRQAKLRNPVRHWLGKKRGPQTEATKAKIAQALVGRPKPDGFGEAVAEKLRGVPRPAHVVAKMRATMQRPEMRERMAAHTRGKPTRHLRNPVDYNGVRMKSTYEVRVARALDTLGVPWQYEPARFDCGGFSYAPDFYLPEDCVFWEVKGWYGPSSRRAVEAFRHQHDQFPLVLMGLSAIKMLEASAQHVRGISQSGDRTMAAQALTSGATT